MAEICPDIERIGEIGFADFIQLNAAGDRLVAAQSWNFHEYSYPDFTLLQSVALNTPQGVILDDDDNLYIHTSTQLKKKAAGDWSTSAYTTIANTFSPSINPATGTNRGLAYNPADGFLYMLANGVDGSVGQRIVRWDPAGAVGQVGTVVFEFPFATYDATVTPTPVSIFNGYLYGIVHPVSGSTSRTAFVYDIAADTVAYSTPGLFTHRGVTHDGYGLYTRTDDASRLDAVATDGTRYTVCDALDFHLDQRAPWSCARTDVTLMHRWLTSPLRYEIWREVAVAALDIPTLSVPGIHIPFRSLSREPVAEDLGS